MHQTQLRWQPIAVLLIIAMIWGSNMAFVKIAARDIAPLFMAGVRSLVASICLCIFFFYSGFWSNL